jgi:hypothetical protein
LQRKDVVVDKNRLFCRRQTLGIRKGEDMMLCKVRLFRYGGGESVLWRKGDANPKNYIVCRSSANGILRHKDMVLDEDCVLGYSSRYCVLCDKRSPSGCFPEVLANLPGFLPNNILEE